MIEQNKQKSLSSKLDLRKPKFKNGTVLSSKDLNAMWKDIQKLKRAILKRESK